MNSNNNKRREDSNDLRKWRRTLIIMSMVFLLAAYLVLLLPFLTTEQLASATSLDGTRTIIVKDGGGFLLSNPLTGPGQRIYLWKHWRLFPRVVGKAKNYGDLGSSPDCVISWSERIATVTLTSDEGGTDRFIFDTR